MMPGHFSLWTCDHSRNRFPASVLFLSITLSFSLPLFYLPPHPRPFLHCPLLYGYYLISSSGSNHHPSCILCLPPLWFFPCHLSLPASHVFLSLPFHPPFLTLTGCMTGKYALPQEQANRLAICFYK